MAIRSGGTRRSRRPRTATTASTSHRTCWIATSRQSVRTGNGRALLGTIAAQIPCQAMDISYVWTQEGWLYLAVILELWRQAPFAADHVIARQVPPEIVMLALLAAIRLVAAEDLEGFAIHDEDARRTVGAVLATAAQGR